MKCSVYLQSQNLTVAHYTKQRSAMVNQTDLELDLQKWVSEGFKSYNFETVKLDVTGSSTLGDGFLGGVAFGKVIGVKNKEKVEIDVVIKFGKKAARDKIPVKGIFENEICFYSYIVPMYKKLEQKCNLNILDTFLPKCYNTLLLEDQEVITLENLKAAGYKLYDKFKPLNFEHLKLNFEKYGQMHAFSMAMKKKDSEQYEKILAQIASNTGPKKLFGEIRNLFENTENTVFSILKNEGEIELMNKLKKLTPKGFPDKHFESTELKVKKSVICHGDSWNNNYMYKYTVSIDIKVNFTDSYFFFVLFQNGSKPTSVTILDFQLLMLTSPVYDLSYHLYSTGSEGEFQQFPKLLNTYYESLSTCLKQLGCDPAEEFSFNELKEHWKLYSLYGLLIALVSVTFALSDQDNAISFETADEQIIKDMYEDVKKKNYARMSSRFLPAIRHYFHVLEH